MPTESEEIVCVGCGAKAKKGNGHTFSCSNCGGKTFRYRKKGKIKKINFHPPKTLQPT